jgi:tetratricopeptide (TPR) repeat protein
VWASRGEKLARATAQEAVQERDQARQAAAQAKSKYDEAEAARKAAARDREEELAMEQTAERSAQDTKAVLAFLEAKVLSAGRPESYVGGPKGWPGGLGKNVTLRQAVDRAESEVGKAFADRPLAEASAREALGSAYLGMGGAALAVKQLERSLALRETILGDNDPATVTCRNQLAVAYREDNRPDEASRLYNHNGDSVSHAAALAAQGSLLLSQNKPAEAEQMLRRCLAIRRRIQPDDWTTFDTQSMLGEALLNEKKYAEAEPLLRRGYDGLKEREAKLPPEARGRLTRALERLVRLYEAWDKKDNAARWRKELKAAQAKT